MPKVLYGGGSLTSGGAGEPINDATGQWLPIGVSPRMGATDSGHDTGVLITNTVGGSVSKVYLRVIANTWAAGGSWQLRMRNENGGSPTYQATTIVVDDGDTGEYSDLTTTITMTEGDEYEWEWTRTGGGSGIMNIMGPTYAFTPTSGAAFQWNVGEKTNIPSNTTRFFTPLGDNVVTTEINSMRLKMRIAGTITGFAGRMFTNTRSTDCSLCLQKAGSDIGTACTWAGGATGYVEDAGYGSPVSFAVDDYINVRATGGSGAGTAEYTVCPTTVDPTDDEFQCGVSGNGTVVNAGLTRYFPIVGECVNVTATDGNAKLVAPFDMTLDRFRGYIRANSLSAAETATMNIRVNGTPVRTITWTSGGSPATGEAFASDTSALDVAEGDDLDVSFVTTGASGSAQFMNLTFRGVDASSSVSVVGKLAGAGGGLVGPSVRLVG